jgi:hypothetical protein
MKKAGLGRRRSSRDPKQLMSPGDMELSDS